MTSADTWPIFTVKLKSREEIAERTMAFHFEKPVGWEFKAGQFIDMTLLNPSQTDPEGNKRGFSIASAPQEKTLMVATRLRDTAFKRVLKAMPLETGVKIEGPFGNLTLHNNAKRTAVLLSGGIGITPFRSILFRAAKEQLPHRIFLFYSNRRPEDAPFLEELQALQKENSNYKLVATMNEMDKSHQPWHGETGLIDKEMLSRYLKDAVAPIYYIAGPPGMVKGLHTMINGTGVDDDDIRTEEFDGYFRAAQAGDAETLIILENDLYRRIPPALVDGFLEAVKHVVVLDHLSNDTTARAELLLPAGTFAESDGTLISNEGRAQRFFPVFAQQGDVRESWRWLGDPTWSTLDDLLAALAQAVPQLAPAVKAAPSSKFRMAGAKIPREPHRYSGLTSITANISVVEPKPPDDPDSALAFSMEGTSGQPPGALQPFFWSPGWNSIQAVNKFQSEIGDEIRGGDPGVRLFEPLQSGAYFTTIPMAFARRQLEWLVVPVEHIFGSEELSLRAPAVAELAPAPYLAVNAADAASLHVDKPGGEVEIDLGGTKLRLPLKIVPELPGGIAGIPAGLTPARGAELPVWCRISKAS